MGVPSVQEPLDARERAVLDRLPHELGAVRERARVIELVATLQLPHHPARSVRSRRPPCSSYEDVIRASTSRAPRSVTPAERASASGLRSSPSIPARPSAESASAPALQASHTVPPARAE